MSGGDSGNSQKTTATSQPYKEAEPLLEQGMGDALDLYNKGGLVSANTMSTVVPFSNQTMQGLAGLEQLGAANSGQYGLADQAQNLIYNRGYNTEQHRVAGQLANEIYGTGLNDWQSEALGGIQNTATGAFDINANPAYAGVRQRAIDASTDAVNNTAAGLGRWGSGAHQGVLAREAGNVASDLDFQEYQNWQGRQDSALREMFDMGQTAKTNLASAQDRLFNAGQAATDNLGSAYELAQLPAQTQMQAGSMYEDLMGRQMNDQLRIADETQNLDLANIQALLAAAAGGGSYGTTTQTAQQPNSGLSNLFGTLLGGSSLLFG